MKTIASATSASAYVSPSAEITLPIENNPAPSWMADKINRVSNCGTVILSGITSLMQSPVLKLAGGLCPLNINIAQFGPQVHLSGHDFKATPTFVCNPEGITCFPLHLEYGHKLSGLLGLNAYGLCVNQCGWRHEFNGSLNPARWSCYGVTEKLEHVEVSYPYIETEIWGFTGSIQAIISIETGKTRTFEKKQCLKMVPELLCNIPGALPDLICNLLTHAFISPSQQEKENNNVINKQPISKKNSDPIEDEPADTHFIRNMADSVIKTLVNGITHNDGVYWVGFSLSAGDLNSAINWGNEAAGFSLQWNNYPRKNFMLTWQNGTLSLPANIVDFFAILKTLFGSQEELGKVMEGVMKRVSSAPELSQLSETNKTVATAAIAEFSQKLHQVIATLPDAAGPSAKTKPLSLPLKIMPEESPQPDEVMPSFNEEMRPRSNTMRKRTTSFVF